MSSLVSKVTSHTIAWTRWLILKLRLPSKLGWVAITSKYVVGMATLDLKPTLKYLEGL